MSTNWTLLTLWPDSVVVCALVVALGLALAVAELVRLHIDIFKEPQEIPAALSSPPPRPKLPTATSDINYRALSTLQLCSTLRGSYLAGPCSPAGQPNWAWIQTRGDLLDEIERRDPAGFNRWLASLPQADSDPARYLTPER